MLKRCSVVFAFFVLALCPVIRAQESPAPAGDPTQVIPETQRASREDVERFFTAMRMRKNMEMIFQAMREQMKGMSQKMMAEKLSTLTPEQQQKFLEAMQGNMDDIMNEMRIDDLITDMIPVYQKYLTKKDLEDVVAFYSSPVGQRLLDKTPAMAAEGMKISMDRMEKIMPQIMAKMEKRMNEVMKEIGNGKLTAPKKTPASKT